MTRRFTFHYLLHRVGEGATPIPGLLDFILDTYLIMLRVKQGGIKYHFFFLSLWYDSTRDWTLAIGEHSTHETNGPVQACQPLHYTRHFIHLIWCISIIGVMTFFFNTFRKSSCGGVAKVLNYSLEVSEFELQSRSYVYFWINTLEKDMNRLNYGLNSITAVLLQEWFWHWIIHEGWYAIKQRS